ncbi:hypothetical protein ST47_g7864 [Ascochyta rabiei]|uniref:Uncharacterized protein n=1 Tax=Didymella rabiei TaxID=5454 RepID=A0A163A4Z9_DIDRA|nr:hypothetical protein ST47_g7864 [Ascochyta rabiei]
MVAPEVTLTHLNRADGSATYTHHGYSIIGAVNGPIEVQRRDEQPEEATLEVNVRPSAGVTLQVRSLPEEDTSTGVNTSLTLLPHLLHTALLGLLSASIPLATTLTSVLVAYPSASTKSSTPLLAPTANELLRAKPFRSIHVFAFSGDRRLLLDESDGRFGYDEWEEASELAEEACCREEDEGGVSLRDSMEVDGGVQSKNLHQWLRGIVATKVAYEQRWKSAT